MSQHSNNAFNLQPPPPTQQQQHQQQQQYSYYSPQPTTTTTPSISTATTAEPTPLLLTTVRRNRYFRYDTTLPAELSPYLSHSDYAASVKRFNGSYGCRSWVVTFLLLAVCFMLSGGILLGLGAQQNAYNEQNNTTPNTTTTTNSDNTSTLPLINTTGGNNNTAPAMSIPTPPSEAMPIILKIGIAFFVFASVCICFTLRRWRHGRAKELTNIILIENSRYARRRPVIRFRLVADGWMTKRLQKSNGSRLGIQVEVCGSDDTTTGGSGGGRGGEQQLDSSTFAVVNLPHSNVVNLREKMFLPVRAQASGPAMIDVNALLARQKRTEPPINGVKVAVDESSEDDEVDDNSETPQQPPPAYSDIEMQQPQHNAQPTPQSQPPSPKAERVEGEVGRAPVLSSAAQWVEWQPVKKPAAGDGAVVMLSSQAAVVADESKVREYEERLQRLVAERTQQDEKMQQMQRELETMRARQQQPLVIKLTDYSSTEGVMRSLPVGSAEGETGQSSDRLAVHGNERAEGSTPSRTLDVSGGSRSGVVLIAGRRYSF